MHAPSLLPVGCGVLPIDPSVEWYWLCRGWGKGRQQGREFGTTLTKACPREHLTYSCKLPDYLYIFCTVCDSSCMTCTCEHWYVKVCVRVSSYCWRQFLLWDILVDHLVLISASLTRNAVTVYKVFVHSFPLWHDMWWPKMALWIVIWSCEHLLAGVKVLRWSLLSSYQFLCMCHHVEPLWIMYCVVVLEH